MFCDNFLNENDRFLHTRRIRWKQKNNNNWWLLLWSFRQTLQSKFRRKLSCLRWKNLFIPGSEMNSSPWTWSETWSSWQTTTKATPHHVRKYFRRQVQGAGAHDTVGTRSGVLQLAPPSDFHRRRRWGLVNIFLCKENFSSRRWTTIQPCGKST